MFHNSQCYSADIVGCVTGKVATDICRSIEVKFYAYLSAALRGDGWSGSTSGSVSHSNLWIGG